MPRPKALQRVTLTDEVVILLILAARKGGEEGRAAVDKLRAQYRWVERHFVKQHSSSAKLSGIDEADISAVAQVAMAKAIDRFTYEPGTSPAAKLGAFIQQVVKRALLDFDLSNKRHVVHEELEERSAVCQAGMDSVLDSLVAQEFISTLSHDELIGLEAMLNREKVDQSVRASIRAKAADFFGDDSVL